MSAPVLLHPKRRWTRLRPDVYTQNGRVFLTLCAKGKQPIFGYIENDLLHPTPIGIMVSRQLDAFQHRYEGLSIEQSVLMPNHLHMLLARSSDGIALGQFVNLFKGWSTRACGCPIWQRGYYDHLVRNEQDEMRIREYMMNNPRKWELDKEYYRESTNESGPLGDLGPGVPYGPPLRKQ